MSLVFPGNFLINCSRCGSRYAVHPGPLSASACCPQCGLECVSVDDHNRLVDLIRELLSHMNRMNSLCRDLDISAVFDPTDWCLPDDPARVSPGLYIGAEGYVPRKPRSEP